MVAVSLVLAMMILRDPAPGNERLTFRMPPNRNRPNDATGKMED